MTSEPMSDERLEELEAMCLTTPTFRVDIISALIGLNGATTEIRRLREENAKLREDLEDLRDLTATKIRYETDGVSGMLSRPLPRSEKP